MGASQNEVEDSVGGKCVIPVARLLRSRILWCIEEAERLKGSPANLAEISVVFHHNYTRKINNGYMSAFLQNLYREDAYYCDKNHLVHSMRGPDGSEERKTLERMTERFRRIYPTYIFDAN